MRQVPAGQSQVSDKDDKDTESEEPEASEEPESESIEEDDGMVKEADGHTSHEYPFGV